MNPTPVGDAMKTFARMQFLCVPMVAVALSMAACSEDGTGPQEETPEGLSFRYSGASSGLHASKGVAQIAANGLPAFGTWAVARPDSIGGLVIAGFEKTSG